MKTDCCYFDPIYLCVKLVWLQQFGFSSMSKTKSIRNLVASPSTGEGKGEGAIRITPHPYLLPQGGEGSSEGRIGCSQRLISDSPDANLLGSKP